MIAMTTMHARWTRASEMHVITSRWIATTITFAPTITASAGLDAPIYRNVYQRHVAPRRVTAPTARAPILQNTTTITNARSMRAMKTPE